MEYKVRASLREDMNQGWVWITNTNFSPRSIIKIKNKTNGKSIYCESLKIDSNYIFSYNNNIRTFKINEYDNILTINSWYRKKLGDIKTNSDYSLEIHPSDNYFGKIMACYDHPQIIVRISIWLSIISLFLGCLGFLGLFF